MSPHYKIAIATEHQYVSNAWFDDRVLLDALTDRGHDVSIVDWENASINVDEFDSIFVSSTWNASARPRQFIAWLRSCDEKRPRLINDLAVLEFGLVKYRYWHHLATAWEVDSELASLGRLTPTRFYAAGPPPHPAVESISSCKFPEILGALEKDADWAGKNLVLKPVVGADGINTVVYNRRGSWLPIDDDKRSGSVLLSQADAESAFNSLAGNIERFGAIIQPYMTGVESGEYSLTFLGGVCTHAIQKPGLFKGDGSDRRRAVPLGNLPGTTRAFAERLVGTMQTQFGAGALVRVRVDLFDQDGVPVLCELECVEPNPNIRTIAKETPQLIPSIAEAFARAVEERTAHHLASAPPQL